MSSFKSKLVIFGIQNRNLFKGQLKREVITRETSMVQLRKEFEDGARKFGSIPAGISRVPCNDPRPAGRIVRRVDPPGGQRGIPFRIRQGHLLHPRRWICLGELCGSPHACGEIRPVSRCRSIAL